MSKGCRSGSLRLSKISRPIEVLLVTGLGTINFMHLQMRVAGRLVIVLSRVGEATPDYTGRTNKIAHHVVVANEDRVAGDPLQSC